eukprot:TRINITY_DN19778_c0_g1_i1.p1 TRINITY_DN19778_c0_g1~~TRINITY_DN19778_c0_g1_i1.p1  ORF type:complete len:386 (-),score=52.56 TRINITY_DN19778_c0_g1_i1:70-1173(-)
MSDEWSRIKSVAFVVAALLSLIAFANNFTHLGEQLSTARPWAIGKSKGLPSVLERDPAKSQCLQPAIRFNVSSEPLVSKQNYSKPEVLACPLPTSSRQNEILQAWDKDTATAIRETADLQLGSCYGIDEVVRARHAITTMRIPRIIHYVFIKGKPDAKPHAKAEFWRERCRRLNPGWEIKVWEDKELNQLIASKFPELNASYHGVPHWIQKADTARHLVLMVQGGVYLDMDIECRVPFDHVIHPEMELGVAGKLGRLNNGVIFSAPMSEFHVKIWLPWLRKKLHRSCEGVLTRMPVDLQRRKDCIPSTLTCGVIGTSQAFIQYVESAKPAFPCVSRFLDKSLFGNSNAVLSHYMAYTWKQDCKGCNR